MPKANSSLFAWQPRSCKQQLYSKINGIKQVKEHKENRKRDRLRMAMEIQRDTLATEAPHAPVTYERHVRSDLETRLPKPYKARALQAPDTVYPYGTPGHRHDGFSVLQQHVAFFDLDDNAIVYPWETYTGLRAIGFNRLPLLLWQLSSTPRYVMLLSQDGFLLLSSLYTYATYTKPSMRVIQEHMILKEVNLENIFSKYAHTVPDRLTLREIWDMTKGNRVAFDLFGWIGNKMEWGLLYVLSRDEDGLLSKEAVRRFDGSLFEYCAKMYTVGEFKMD